MFHFVRTAINVDVSMVRVVRSKRAGKVLGCEPPEVIFDRQNLTLHVQVVRRGSKVATRA